MTRVFYVPAHKVDSGEENSPAVPAGIRTRNLSNAGLALLPTSYPCDDYEYYDYYYNDDDGYYYYYDDD